MAEGIRAPNLPLGVALEEMLGLELVGSTKSLRRYTRSQVLGNLDALASGAQAGGGIVFTTLAQANANRNYPANQLAWVVLDDAAANNGVYQKIGSTGSGTWARVADLPYSFYVAQNVGAGTANAIKATSDKPIPAEKALVVFNVATANTDTAVTVSFNNGVPIRIKTSSGNDPVIGGLVPNMLLAGYIHGSEFRLISDQASSAIQAAAEAAVVEAEAARDIATGAMSVFEATAFATKALAEAYEPEAAPDYVRLEGIDDAGTGSGLYAKAGETEPDHGPKFVMSPSVGNPIWYKGSNEILNMNMFGAKGNDSKDNYNEFLDAASLGRQVIVPDGIFRIGTPVALASGSWFCGLGMKNSLIKAMTAGQRLFHGIDLESVAFTHLGLAGEGATSTVPSSGVDIFSAADTGLLTFARCASVAVKRSEVSGFYSCVSNLRSDRIWIDDGNYIHNWYALATHLSGCRQWWVDRNVIKDCDRITSGNAYACSSTGDDSDDTHTVRSGSFSFNHVENIPVWDAFMTHGGRNLRLKGNRMKNVRTGFDISHYDTTDGIIIDGNDIEGTGTDVWDGSPAIHGAIHFATDIGGNQATSGDVIVTNNRCKNFFTVSGMAIAGQAAVIEITDVDRAVVKGNVISGTGGYGSPSGIVVAGTDKSVVIAGNIVDGKHPSGGIRTGGASIDNIVIEGNVITQTTSSDAAIYVDSGSSIGNLSHGNNATNSSQPIVITGTVTKNSGSGYSLAGASSYAGGTFASGSSSTIGTINVSGAAMGDMVRASYDADLQGVALLAWVGFSGVVSVKFVNNTGGEISLAAGTIRVSVVKGI